MTAEPLVDKGSVFLCFDQEFDPDYLGSLSRRADEWCKIKSGSEQSTRFHKSDK